MTLDHSEEGPWESTKIFLCDTVVDWFEHLPFNMECMDFSSLKQLLCTTICRDLERVHAQLIRQNKEKLLELS